MSKEKLSVANDIKALALINIQDIFHFTLTAKDEAIEKRYGTEERALKVAREYLDIATVVDMLEYPIKGWSMRYSRPLKDSEERKEYTAYFYDVKESEEGTVDHDGCDGCEYEDRHRGAMPCIGCKYNYMDLYETKRK